MTTEGSISDFICVIKNEIIMCDVKRDLQTPPPFQTTTFSQTPPWSVKYFMHGRKTFITLHSVIQRRSRPNYSALAGCYSPIQVLCLCLPLRLDTPCTWNYYTCHLSSRRDEVKTVLFLTHALMPLESIANLNDAI